MTSKATKQSMPFVGFIGGYLVDQGAITLLQLDEALRRQIEWGMQNRSMSLDRVLIELGYVTPAQINQAMLAQQADLAAKHGVRPSRGSKITARTRTTKPKIKPTKKVKKKRR